jgi:7-cyano-7-deazaguanine reductase
MKTKVLGRPVKLPSSPEEAILDRVPNTHPDLNFVARFTCPEFTSLCPVTGQPDFGTFVIDYVPDKWLLESKSLKLFIFSFRNHGAFHEDCTVMVGARIADVIKPRFMRVASFWNPRGGIPIDVFWEIGTLPDGVRLPDTGVATYRGRT